jgi:hypothetical protein
MLPPSTTTCFFAAPLGPSSSSTLTQTRQVVPTCRSTLGYTVFLGDKSWSSKIHNVVSHLSAEVEYRVVANGVTEVCWLCQLLLELHNPLSRATLVYGDNVIAVYLSTNLIQHVKIDLQFVRERVAVGDGRALHFPTTS